VWLHRHGSLDNLPSEFIRVTWTVFTASCVEHGQGFHGGQAAFKQLVREIQQPSEQAIAGNHLQVLIEQRYAARKVIDDRLDDVAAFWGIGKAQQIAEDAVFSMLIGPIVIHFGFQPIPLYAKKILSKVW
jgi:hypothetical protein